MKYTAKYFKDAMPEWKRKKDFWLARILFREPSYYLSAICANWGIGANTVSYFSAIVAIVGAICYLMPSYYAHVVGAFFVVFWSILDCVDGNLARSVKKQPFGVFADAISSYILVGIICMAMGVAVYHDGGAFVNKGRVVFIVLGALASSSDSLMRLIYQKYKNTEAELARMGVLEISYDERLDINQTTSWKVRIESWFGIDGVLNVAIFVATILNALDIVVIYCLFYFGGAFIYSVINMVKKAVKLSLLYSEKMPQ